jgi:hypothetical protein
LLDGCRHRHQIVVDAAWKISLALCGQTRLNSRAYSAVSLRFRLLPFVLPFDLPVFRPLGCRRRVCQELDRRLEVCLPADIVPSSLCILQFACATPL